MDYSIVIAVIAQALTDDPTLGALVDFIIPGFQREKADRYLEGPHQTCLGVRTLNLNSQALPGCAYHNISDHDHLIKFNIIQISDNDSGVAAIAHRIQQIMKKPISVTMNSTNYNFGITGPIRFSPVLDENFLDRAEATGTCRLKYLGE